MHFCKDNLKIKVFLYKIDESESSTSFEASTSHILACNVWDTILLLKNYKRFFNNTF